MDSENVYWDKKKILLGVIVLSIIAWFGYQNREMILAYNTPPVKEVAGVETVGKPETKKEISVPQFDVQQKISEITDQVTNLDVSEVAASSPQIQKVLKDMESLKNLPKNQAKDACMSICSSL